MANYRVVGTLEQTGGLKCGLEYADAEITVAVSHMDISLRPDLLDILHPSMRWSAVAMAEYLGIEPELLAFAKRNREEVVSVGNFGVGVIEDVKIRTNVVRVHDGFERGWPVYTYKEKHWVEVEIRGIGPLTVPVA